MNNVDLETANKVNLDLRVPFLEINGIKEVSIFQFRFNFLTE